jgi:hypothetical protein
VPELCRTCGYDLAGLPQPGGVATCPECAASNPFPPPPKGPEWGQRMAAAVFIFTPFFVAAAATFMATFVPANQSLGTPLQIVMIIAIAWTAGTLAMLVLSPIRKRIDRRRFRAALRAAITLVLFAPATVAIAWIALFALALRFGGGPY